MQNNIEWLRSKIEEYDIYCSESNKAYAEIDSWFLSEQALNLFTFEEFVNWLEEQEQTSYRVTLRIGTESGFTHKRVREVKCFYGDELIQECTAFATDYYAKELANVWAKEFGCEVTFV